MSTISNFGYISKLWFVKTVFLFLLDLVVVACVRLCVCIWGVGGSLKVILCRHVCNWSWHRPELPIFGIKNFTKYKESWMWKKLCSFWRGWKQRDISIIRIMGVEWHSGISFGYFWNISIIRKYRRSYHWIKIVILLLCLHILFIQMRKLYSFTWGNFIHSHEENSFIHMRKLHMRKLRMMHFNCDKNDFLWNQS